MGGSSTVSDRILLLTSPLLKWFPPNLPLVDWSTFKLRDSAMLESLSFCPALFLEPSFSELLIKFARVNFINSVRLLSVALERAPLSRFPSSSYLTIVIGGSSTVSDRILLLTSPPSLKVSPPSMLDHWSALRFDLIDKEAPFEAPFNPPRMAILAPWPSPTLRNPLRKAPFDPPRIAILHSQPFDHPIFSSSPDPLKVTRISLSELSGPSSLTIYVVTCSLPPPELSL